jgi:WD40 repeat protein
MGYRLNPFEAPPRVFISYARSDGTELASTLRERLEREHPDITLWLDRAQMMGGIGWWKQITEALDKVEIMIMVLTPGAIQSEVAAKEWRYARQQGVRVCPVMKRDSILDFEVLPGWMRKAHCYDIDVEWETFLSFLHSSGKVDRVPFMAPDPPEYYVQRRLQFEALLSHLLDESGENPQFFTIALQGPGGFGKTTLASSLCHHENIISSFDDGILWASLGETPNIQGELTKLYAALTGDRPPFIDTDDASIQLAERLDQKNCLLVVDDVWDPNHLKPFMRGGSQCARLITTRKLSVVTEVGATRTVVDKMTVDQAVEMLTARIHYSPDDLTSLKDLVERLGEWPLLLKLAGSQLKERMERGDSLNGALAYIGRAMEKMGVVAFDRANPKARNDAIASTVGASLELFSAEDQSRCAELAVFRNDASFPLEAACTLWALDEFDAENLILRLDDTGLLEFDLKIGMINIHNVLRSHLESQINNVKELHSRLIGKWLHPPYALPNVYACKWIGWHLAQAGEYDRLKQLLLDFDWLKSRLKAVQIQAVLQDFELLEDSEDTRIVRDALRLASHGLSIDPNQLRVQLSGRIDRGRYQSIDELLDKADASETRSKLVLTGTSLTHPGGALTGILKSHSGAVEALAVSPDGHWVVSGSEDWTLRLWDLKTNRVVRTFEGHTGTVHAVAFTPDGQSILSGSEDRMLFFWDINTAKLKWKLRGHTLAVQGVAISDDGKLASSVSEDGTVRVWDLESKQSRTVFKGRDHQLNAIAITNHGFKLIFGAGDWTIKIIDLENDTEKTFKGHSGIVRSLVLTPDGTRLLSGADDGTVRVWVLETGELLLNLTGHAGSVDSVAVTPDGGRAISGSRDKTLRVWSLETGEVLQTLRGHSGFVKSIAISVSTLQILSGSADRTIRNWNIESAHSDQSKGGHTEAVALLSISADGSRAISGIQGGELIVWDANAEDKRHDGVDIDRCEVVPWVMGRRDGHTDIIHSLKMTADGRQAVTGSRDRTLRVWDVSRRATKYVLKGHAGEIFYLDVSEDGTRAVSISRDRTLRVWDLIKGQNIRVLVSEDNERALSSLRVGDAMLAELDIGPKVDLSKKPISRNPRIAMSPDGQCVVLGSQGNFCSWDLNTGIVQEQDIGDFHIASIAFDTINKRIVLGSLFGPLLMWDFKQAPFVFEGHVGKVLDIVVSPNGKNAISASSDDTIRIWDLNSLKQKAQLTGTFGKADAVAIAPNGHFAYSIYGDTFVAYDLDDLARLASISFDHQVTTIAVTPAGECAAIGDQSGQVHFLRLQT